MNRRSCTTRGGPQDAASYVVRRSDDAEEEVDVANAHAHLELAATVQVDFFQKLWTGGRPHERTTRGDGERARRAGHRRAAAPYGQAFAQLADALEADKKLVEVNVGDFVLQRLQVRLAFEEGLGPAGQALQHFGDLEAGAATRMGIARVRARLAGDRIGTAPGARPPPGSDCGAPAGTRACPSRCRKAPGAARCEKRLAVRR